MVKLQVETHPEGQIHDLRLTVHGQKPDGDGIVEAYSSPAWVRFAFQGRAGARLRVEIRQLDNGAIVYREEVQLAPSAGDFDSRDRFFGLDDEGAAKRHLHLSLDQHGHSELAAVAASDRYLQAGGAIETAVLKWHRAYSLRWSQITPGKAPWAMDFGLWDLMLDDICDDFRNAITPCRIKAGERFEGSLNKPLSDLQNRLANSVVCTGEEGFDD